MCLLAFIPNSKSNKKNEKKDKQAKIVYEIMTNAAIKNR